MIARSSRRRRVAVLPAPLCAAATALLLALGPSPAAAAPLSRGAVVSPRALEAKHGLRITRVALVGGGGLVDLRFRVLDLERARPLLADHRSPRLRVEESGTELPGPGHGSRGVQLRDGAACFVLFPNAGGAARRGGRVSVAFGDLQVGPVAVQ
jgi:hypothetical protein